MNELARILIVEDDPKDVELTLTALEEYNLANEVVVTRAGEEALDYLYCLGTFAARTNVNPTVLLLDIKFPTDGEVDWPRLMKSFDKLKSIHLVLLRRVRDEDT